MRIKSGKCRGARSILWLVVLLFLMHCSGREIENGMVLFTRIPVTKVSVAQLDDLDYRYVAEMQIAMTEMEAPEKDNKILTHKFYSARSAEWSHDGRKIVFSGQKEKENVWQIWTMDLKNNKAVQITISDKNATDPAWLPDGSIVYSQVVSEESGLEYHALYTIGEDGCCNQRITFHPHNDFNASVLNDGRILYSSQQIFPDTGMVKFMVMRPDGTKAELFYLPEYPSSNLGRAFDDFAGNIAFAESGALTMLNFNRPLRSNRALPTVQECKTLSTFSLDPEHMIISMRKPAEPTYGLHVLSLNNGDMVRNSPDGVDYHCIEPVVSHHRSPAKKLPTQLNNNAQTGYFVCMNADYPNLESGKANSRTSKVQVIGKDEAVGETTVEEDGSFYIEITADYPVRFQTLNAEGEILGGPSSWMWVRPGERRGCVGCHVNKEIAPANMIPKAIEKAAVALEY